MRGCPVAHLSSELLDWKSLPMRMKTLPRDERGFPVPWFVAWQNGKPEFRAMDGAKYIAALRENRCWVCGDKMGITRAFVAGPMCGINRTAAEPPCHVECARWSAMNCPFLANPRMVRREDEAINIAASRENSPGIMITRNPGVAMVWITRQFEVFDDGNGRTLIHMGEPETVEWYACGRKATRQEVEHSINTGLPILRALAETQDGALPFLQRAIDDFQKFLPL